MKQTLEDIRAAGINISLSLRRLTDALNNLKRKEIAKPKSRFHK